jgi:hypothetical protein
MGLRRRQPGGPSQQRERTGRADGFRPRKGFAPGRPSRRRWRTRSGAADGPEDGGPRPDPRARPGWPASAGLPPASVDRTIEPRGVVGFRGILDA